MRYRPPNIRVMATESLRDGAFKLRSGLTLFPNDKAPG